MWLLYRWKAAVVHCTELASLGCSGSSGAIRMTPFDEVEKHVHRSATVWSSTEQAYHMTCIFIWYVIP